MWLDSVLEWSSVPTYVCTLCDTQVDKSCIKWLCNSSNFIEYVDASLLDERQSLNNHHIYQFFCNFFPKVRVQ